jgi:hypothetical protein
MLRDFKHSQKERTLGTDGQNCKPMTNPERQQSLNINADNRRNEMATIKKLTIYRSVQTNNDACEWRYYLDNDRDYDGKIYNPSGVALEDRAYEGMGEIQVITPAQAQGEKKQALINCGLYSARLKAKKHGDLIPDGVEVSICK